MATTVNFSPAAIPPVGKTEERFQRKYFPSALVPWASMAEAACKVTVALLPTDMAILLGMRSACVFTWAW